jgi:hypothetical protein
MADGARRGKRQGRRDGRLKKGLGEWVVRAEKPGWASEKEIKRKIEMKFWAAKVNRPNDWIGAG